MNVNKLLTGMLITLVVLMVIVFTYNGQQKQEAKAKEESLEENYEKQRLALILKDKQVQQERIKLAKDTPAYKEFTRNKEKVEQGMRKKIDGCYQWSKATRKSASSYVLNSNKLEALMKKEGLSSIPGKLNCYSGLVKGHPMTVTFGAPRPSSSGWVHSWDVSYEF